jgi:hypothetical protein
MQQMTSACLSKGAQGEEKSMNMCQNCGHINFSCREYKNFEIGVLFHSNRQHQYRALSSCCVLHSHSIPAFNEKDEFGSFVHILPVPYDIVSRKKYCIDLDFKLNPFMKSFTGVRVCVRLRILYFVTFICSTQLILLDRRTSERCKKCFYSIQRS